MKEEQKKKTNSVISQIAIAVVIAMLVGGSAPWWWDKVFPTERDKSQETNQATPEPETPPQEKPEPKTPPQERPEPETLPQTPESLSRTDYSLSGDAIVHFRVFQIHGRSVTIEVDYKSNVKHGDKVMVGAWLKGVPSAFKPTFVQSPREGTARLEITVSKPGISTDLDIFLYEWGRPSEEFAHRTFPYKMKFE